MLRSAQLEVRSLQALARIGPLAALVAALLTACSAPPPPPPPEAARGDLAESLVELGERALERGALDDAVDRFERALEAQPGSASATVGLGQVALRRGGEAEAEARFREALQLDPDSADARIALGRLLASSGRASQARAQFALAVELDPWRSEVHAALASLVGDAPRTPVETADDALRVARAHPYDAWAGLRAGSALAREGRAVEAVEQLEGVLWIADLDPAAARIALEHLGELDPGWRDRRAVPVHSFADDGLRAQPGWRFRLRLTWLGLSRALRETLGVTFVPASFGAFTSSDEPAELDAILRAFRSQTPSPSPHGILAAFTDRQPVRRSGKHKRGAAEFLGRRLIVRIEPEGSVSRVLVHEVLHLYGGVHVLDSVASIMNPSGRALVLDPPNAEIVRELRARRFSRRGVEADVFPWIDLEATTAAYETSLRVNLAFRRAGVAQALQAARRSRRDAARRVHDAIELDAHLGDVSRFVATLMLRSERFAEAIWMLDAAAQLYGPQSAKGREAQVRADALRRRVSNAADERS